MAARGGGNSPCARLRCAGVPAIHQVLEALPAVTPGLAHDAPPVEVEHVEHNQRHRAVRALPHGEHGAANLRLFRLVSEVLHAIEAGVFHPNPGWQCKDCPFQSRCWAWRCRTGPGKDMHAMMRAIPRSGSRKANGYVKADLALEAVRRKREDRYAGVMRPLDRRRDALAAEVATRRRALSGGQLAAAQRPLAMIAQATANAGAAKRGVTRYCSTTTTPPSAVGPRPPVGRAPCPAPRIRLRSRGAPARLEPRRLLGRQDQPVDPSVTHRVRVVPAGVPRRLASAVSRLHVKIHCSPCRFSKYPM